jgi:hypothetical protein
MPSCAASTTTSATRSNCAPIRPSACPACSNARARRPRADGQLRWARACSNPARCWASCRDLREHLLGEELLPSVATWWCGEPAACVAGAGARARGAPRGARRALRGPARVRRGHARRLFGDARRPGARGRRQGARVVSDAARRPRQGHLGAVARAGEPAFTLLRTTWSGPRRPGALGGARLPSRLAENLFWFGRYPPRGCAGRTAAWSRCRASCSTA